ncbi:MAG: hotdog fold thioesterase [Crocinitomicaceae bacterium]|jgi:1,4-dihydroxy-2-naphthoyl-CoA hydrolase|nr:hotdog fold thioesterase [Crocinitomicaceae bacterium]
MKLKQISLEEINARNANTLMESLEISCVELGEDYIVARMPVNERTVQPMGLLHGGASAALIETIGSMGSILLIDNANQIAVGLEVNANHINGIAAGFVLAKGKIIHAGRKTHLWQVDITEEGTGKLICVGKLTVLILEKRI